MNKFLKISKHIASIQLKEDLFVAWNKYSPSILLLTSGGAKLLRNPKAAISAKDNRRYAKFVETLAKHQFLYSEAEDPYKQIFYDSIFKKITDVDNNATEFYNRRGPYNNLYISNDHCNLNCGYCIRTYKNEYNYTSKAMVPKERTEKILSIVDQYIQERIKHETSPVPISFNGGEILLEWELIEEIIKRIEKKYHDIKFAYFMNTNMTLMNEGISKFLSDHNVEVHLSIDCYREIHNKTRKYHNGAGSFDDVIRGLSIFREHNIDNKIYGFQGTVEYPGEIIPEEIFRMNEYDFVEARLAPNLLNISKADARRKARLMGKLFKMNIGHKLKVTDGYFDNMKKLVNMNNYSFFFTCVGLSCFPSFGINLNISKMSLSLLCSYINKAAVPLEQINYDIYHRNLWERAREFIMERANSIKEKCVGCNMVGICRGGCIMSGLDNENQMNAGACEYQREIWKKFLQITAGNITFAELGTEN